MAKQKNIQAAARAGLLAKKAARPRAEKLERRKNPAAVKRGRKISVLPASTPKPEPMAIVTVDGHRLGISWESVDMPSPSSNVVLFPEAGKADPIPIFSLGDQVFGMRFSVEVLPPAAAVVPLKKFRRRK